MSPRTVPALLNALSPEAASLPKWRRTVGGNTSIPRSPTALTIPAARRHPPSPILPELYRKLLTLPPFQHLAARPSHLGADNSVVVPLRHWLDMHITDRACFVAYVDKDGDVAFGSLLRSSGQLINLTKLRVGNQAPESVRIGVFPGVERPYCVFCACRDGDALQLARIALHNEKPAPVAARRVAGLSWITNQRMPLLIVDPLSHTALVGIHAASPQSLGGVVVTRIDDARADLPPAVLSRSGYQPLAARWDRPDSSGSTLVISGRDLATQSIATHRLCITPATKTVRRQVVIDGWTVHSPGITLTSEQLH